jgi:hypothetical protein
VVPLLGWPTMKKSGSLGLVIVPPERRP